MFRNAFFLFFVSISIFTFLSCDNPPDVLQSEEVRYGKVSGKIIHTDNNLLVRAIAEDGVDTVELDPESGMFIFDSVRYGLCIIQVSAVGYGVFQLYATIDKPQFICHDIVLTRFPPQVTSVFPPSCQNLDSLYFTMDTSAITDSGFLLSLVFNDRMDTPTFDNAFTILPDSAGVMKEWNLDLQLSLVFPYSKLATTDTLKVSLSRKVKNQWGDTLDHDLSVFYPIDTNFIRTNWLEKR